MLKNYFEKKTIYSQFTLVSRQTILTLVYLRHHLIFQVLGLLFQVSDINLCRERLYKFHPEQRLTDTYLIEEILARGLRETETFINSHILGERVVLLTGNNAVISKLVMETLDIDEPRYLKAPSGTQTLAMKLSLF